MAWHILRLRMEKMPSSFGGGGGGGGSGRGVVAL
jgi:hypothetical protein